jgi:hypothetical protein
MIGFLRNIPGKVNFLNQAIHKTPLFYILFSYFAKFSRSI